jgi:flagella basal body P-ring formation protein FlgA
VAVVRFLPESEVQGGPVLLGQIATLSGPDALIGDLRKYPVGPSAAFGLTRWIDGETVAMQLQDRNPGKVLVANPKIRVAVSTRADTLSRDSLAAKVQSFLARRLHANGSKWNFSWVREPTPILLPSVPHSLELDFAGRKRRGKLELGLAVKAGADVLRTYPLAVNVIVEERVRVATRRIQRGEVLGDGNTRVVLRETTHFSPEGLPDPAKIPGMQAKQSIPDGRVLTHNLVAWPPVVRRGEGAQLVARAAGLRIATEVVCRQDGVPGQIISARHPETRRLLRARVLENGELEPVPGGS